MHSHHEDIHTRGLADGCAACREHAEKPTASLDDVALRDLIDRTLRNRFGSPTTHVDARSDTEAVAMASVMNALERTGKIASVAPDLLNGYLYDRWHLSFGVAAG